MAPALALLLAFSAALAACGQVLLKVGANGRASLAAFANGWIVLGLASYAAGVAIWVYALSKAPLYAVYPFTLLTFLLVGAASVILFGERPSATALVGWAAILLGLMIVYAGSAQA